MQKLFGAHLGDGNRGAKFRFCEVEPLLSKGDVIVFDFAGVTNMTDSFANACFGILAQNHSEELGKRLSFKNCSPLVHDFLVAAVSLGMKRARSFA